MPIGADSNEGWNAMNYRHQLPLLFTLACLLCVIPGFAQDKTDNFFLAIYEGNLNAVKQFVNKGGDVNTAGADKQTPLMSAASTGRPDVFHFLLSKGAHPDAVDATGKSVLMWAAETGRVEIVQTLLAKKVRVHLKDTAGNNALTWACAWKEGFFRGVAEESHGKVVSLLLEAGCEMNVRNKRGYTPLILAAQGGSISCVRALLAKGAEVNVQAADHSTALLLATDYGYSEVTGLLIEHHASIQVANANGRTPLMLAAENGDARSVRLLLEQGAEVNQRDKKGHTAYDVALRVNVGAILKGAGARSADTSSDQEQGDKTAHEVDFALYTLILADLRRVGNFSPWRWSQEKGRMGPRVLNETKTFRDDEVQNLKWEIERDGKNGHTAQTDILDDVKRRNKRVAALTGYPSRFEARTISSQELEQAYDRKKLRAFDPRCILHFALPGYSADGNKAYVFFWFSDGGWHGGGRGVYCLEKRDGIWQVAWNVIGFYV